MKIPVFVSSPTHLSPTQEAARKVVLAQLSRNNLEPRALGRSDYPTELPLREVLLMARHCSGGVILGFEQFRSTAGISQPGTARERRVRGPKPFPTPWNQLEAGILFGLRLPLLIFREEGIEGGVFDNGVTDVFIHPMPAPNTSGAAKKALQEVFLNWRSKVGRHYYDDSRR